MIKITSFPPVPELERYVHFLWIAETSEGNDEFAMVVPPSGFALLTLFIGSNRYHVKLTGKESELLPRAAFQGQHYGSVETKSKFNDTLTIGIMFKPTAVHQLWGIPMDSLTHKLIDAEAILGLKLINLMNKLQQDEAYLTKLYWVNDFLQDAVAHRVHQTVYCEEVVSYMNQHNGSVSVYDVAKHFKRTTRFLERKFKMEVGISPKYLNRIFQFNHTLSILKYSPDIKWSDLAQRAGYFDQAHLIKAFIEFSGKSPVQYDETDNRFTQTHLTKDAEKKPFDYL